MTKSEFEALLNRIGRHLISPTSRSHALSSEQKLCVTLNFLGCNSMYHEVGRAGGITKSTVCRYIHETVRAINYEMFQKEVSWPTRDEEICQLPRRFYDFAKMPNVCGCVDGTLIQILAPSVNEPQFVDRHGNHSINCMMVSGPDYRFYYCSANWPDSVNDCRVLSNSSLYRTFEKDGWRPFPKAILLGDSIYPCKEWLIPPIPDVLAKSDKELKFNRSHKSTRRTVEQTLG